MTLEPLVESIIACLNFPQDATQPGRMLGTLDLRRSARLPVLSAIHRVRQQPVIFLTDRADRALALSEEMALWEPGAGLYDVPEPTPLFYEKAAWGDTTRRERLAAITRLAAYHIPGLARPASPPIFIIPARALMTRTMPRREFLKATRTLKLRQAILLDDLVRTCLRLGYDSVNTVVASGQLAHRGGIIDIWPPADPQPWRLEFFGNEIETMRVFDPATQRTVGQSHSPDAIRLLLTPAREFIVPADHPMAQDLGEVSEFHLPLFHVTPASILDFLPRDSSLVIDDMQSLKDTVLEIEEQAVNMREEEIRAGILEADFPEPYLSWSEIIDNLSGHDYLVLGSGFVDEVFAGVSEQAGQDGSLSSKFSAGPRFAGHLKLLMDHLNQQLSAGHQVVIVSRQTARLKELWQEQSTRDADNQPAFIEGSLTEGFELEAPSCPRLELLTDGEIFGWRRPEPRKRVRHISEAPEAGFADLEVDGYVVHVDHGIGLFKGIERRSVEGTEREYLRIEYADEAQLFVPVHQADRLTRYVGPDSRTPTLSRLGGSDWRNTKSAVKEAVKEVAEELLDLYARRKVVTGFAFSRDTTWQGELEGSFPYIETDDQKRVLVEVKRDMENMRPMDRLICGDVGYGKTEIALRAAFKAVMDGKQVAILVPTTVLAQQHYHTFQQRLAAFPVQVEMLSRFRTQQQQAEIIPLLEQGKIDIVIGTHRLLSRDVRFKDLGLLVIDEEQRFGVTHKETLKKMRTEVDVLTLTATPIPRTLYMALSGIRDISTINTPPEERLPIQTHVGPYSSKLVRQAVLRELERGGQVFMVHNRVQTIEAMHSHLRQIVPEARIAVAHGQMPENELSQRMEKFSAGDVDILLSTSIIESGLDIPNANTLIVDRADMFGLAQLYQLRGRVGRGAQRAYAYFFRHKKKPPSFEGRQRLDTIAENTQLGAGFSIAMRDMEIRGMGDILGTRQHGHIAAIGFHLYTSLLADAVRRLQGQEQSLDVLNIPTYHLQNASINVDLPFSASIPTQYVPDKHIRLGMYRRMADMRSTSELEALVDEFTDRFGPPPEAVYGLLTQLKIKLLAEKAGLSSITIESGQLALRFPDGSIPPGLAYLGPQVRTGKTALWMPYQKSQNWLEQLFDVLHRLSQDDVAQSSRELVAVKSGYVS